MLIKDSPEAIKPRTEEDGTRLTILRIEKNASLFDTEYKLVDVDHRLSQVHSGQFYEFV